MISPNAAYEKFKVTIESSAQSKLTHEARAWLLWWCTEGRNRAGTPRRKVLETDVGAAQVGPLAELLSDVDLVGGHLARSMALEGVEQITVACLRSLEIPISAKVPPTPLCNSDPPDEPWLAERWMDATAET